MARPRTPAAETPPNAPPLVSIDNLPSDELFSEYRSVVPVKLAGPFAPPVEVVTADGTVTTDEDVWIGIDASGQPYVVTAYAFQTAYAPVDFGDEPGPHWQVGAPVEEVNLDAIRKEAFEEGVAEGVRRANAKQQPIFETAKQLAHQHVAADESYLAGLIDDLETERGETLSGSDRELVLGIHRRLRAHQKQRDLAAREPGAARRQPPAAPKQTEYQHVS